MYSKEEEEILQLGYDGSKESVDLLAEKLGKKPRSVIGKLSRMGIYKKEPYRTKLGEEPMTKREMVETICSWVDIDYDDLSGLEKTPKMELRRLYNYLETLQ